ncbi:MAG: hypothetical protein ABJN20_05895, partial [Lentilitoribacter sp.]
IRNERIKMCPHLKSAYEPIHESLMAVENSGDSDFIEAGFEAVRRKLAGEMPDGPYNPSYELALGNPHHIFSTIKNRVDTQIKYIDSLISLFSPHFRTTDAYSAMTYLDALRDPSRELNIILQKMQWLRSAAESFEKFGEHLTSVDESEETGGEDGVEMREELMNNMRENITNEVNDIFSMYKSLDNRAQACQKALDELILQLEKR